MRLLAPLLLAGILTLGHSPAAAQVSVEVSPLRVELQAGPDSTTTQPVTVTNFSKDAIRLRATLTDWDLARDGTPQFEGAEVGGRYSATAWVRLAPPEQVIEPGAQATVRFSLTVPPGVEPAGYRTGILFQFEPASGDPIVRSREVTFKSRVATLIYVNIGAPPLAAELVDLGIQESEAALAAIAVVKNSSQRSTRTKGSLILTDEAGSVVRELKVPDVPLLPESEREVAIPITGEHGGGPLPDGSYRIELRLDVGLPAVLVGETTLTIAR